MGCLPLWGREGVILPIATEDPRATIDRGFLQSQLNKIIAAICHGVLVPARTFDPATGHSILYGRRVTALLKVLERASWYLTAWRLGDYYRTYPKYVENEVKQASRDPGNFIRGRSIREPLVVEDGNFITARWPGDARAFAERVGERVLNVDDRNNPAGKT